MVCFLKKYLKVNIVSLQDKLVDLNVKRRSTPAQQEILQILKNSSAALSQDMIEAQMMLKTDRATIYRVLNRFCEDGLTHKIVAEDGKSYFALCHSCTHAHQHDHFHFKCNKCQKIECLNQLIQIAVPNGYIVQDMNCIVSGICAECLTA